MPDVLQRLASVEPDTLPILSVYLDMRPQATGENPQTRSGMVHLKDRMSEIVDTYWPRGPELESVQADGARIEEYLGSSEANQAQGLAIFACSGREMFEVVEAGVPFENQVSVGPIPDLFQLARLQDDQETAVVAVVDTNTARLFVAYSGFLKEVDGPDDKNTKFFHKGQMGGWSQARYQRNIDNNRERFAKESAQAIEHLVDREKATHVILAGDEVAIPLLQNALSERVKGLVHDEVLRIDIRASEDNLQAEVEPILTRLEAEESASMADQLIGQVRAGGLGVIGAERTRQALEYGQVDTLLLTLSPAVDEEARNEMVHLAANTSAHVEVVEEHEAFQKMGGVGALLRYRLPDAAQP